MVLPFALLLRCWSPDGYPKGPKKPLIPGPASVETSRPLFKLLAEPGDGVIHVREFQQDKWWYNGGINDGVVEI